MGQREDGRRDGYWLVHGWGWGGDRSRAPESTLSALVSTPFPVVLAGHTAGRLLVHRIGAV